MTYVKFVNPFDYNSFHGHAIDLKIGRNYSKFTIVDGGVTTHYEVPTA